MDNVRGSSAQTLRRAATQDARLGRSSLPPLSESSSAAVRRARALHSPPTLPSSGPFENDSENTVGTLVGHESLHAARRRLVHLERLADCQLRPLPSAGTQHTFESGGAQTDPRADLASHRGPRRDGRAFIRRPAPHRQHALQGKQETTLTQ